MANVVVGVTGGIAAFKSASLIRLFTKSGHSVKVVATANATRFIGEITLEALSHNKVEIVDPDMFSDVESVKHVSIAQGADLLVVAPATASFIAKIAHGISDDLLTTTVLTARCPVVIAPAMHTEMWENLATQQNIETIRSRGMMIVNPATGRLTGNDVGVGRLAEPEEIIETCLPLLGPGHLNGIRVLVTTGGTREQIDPARYIGNYSSGKQGMAFAKAARDLGAKVQVIAANVEEDLVKGFNVEHVVSSAELEKLLESKIEEFDLLVMAAAVADYRPSEPSADKIMRSQVGKTFIISMVENPDILADVATEIRSRNLSVQIIGFAAESGVDLQELASKKLVSKGCDYIVANNISNGQVFGSENNSVVLTSSDKHLRFSGTKYEIARSILEEVSSNVVRTTRGVSK